MSVFLPNAANWSFYMPTLLRLYINLLTFPGKLGSINLDLVHQSLTIFSRSILLHHVAHVQTTQKDAQCAQEEEEDSLGL